MKKKQRSEKLVSIIMPTYNRAYTIQRAIVSVQKQTYTDFELLIIDDGSKDDTKDVVNSLEDERIHYIRYENNQGACHARNVGLKNASGRYIAFLDSDNKWDKCYLEERVKRIKSCQHSVGFVWGPARVIERGKPSRIMPDEDGHKSLRKNNKKRLVEKMIYDNQIDTNTVMMKRVCMEQAGGFCEELMRLQDWEYFFRTLINTEYRAFFDDRVLVTNYIEKDSIGSRKNSDKYWKSRIYFLREYKDIINEYCDLNDVYCYLLSMENPMPSQEHIAKIIEEMEGANLLPTVIRFRKKIEKERDKLNRTIASQFMLHDKEYRIIEFQNKWINTLIDDSNQFVENIIKKNVSSVAIYGIGWIGKNLYKLLKRESELEVACLMDAKLANTLYMGQEVVDVSQYGHDADIVISTVLGEYETIRRKFDDEDNVIDIECLLMDGEM